MHEVIIPRKGYFKLKLPDGSSVWLNAESSIKYPSSFPAHERRVEVTGETYFEVAKDPSKPFVVAVNRISVTALGTAFNVNAYSNEGALQATLVEGSIKVSAPNKEKVLKVNEQISIHDQDWKVKSTETSYVIAWVDNKFKFKNETIEEVMRKIERWYDIKVSYKDEIKFHFNGTIHRDLPVSKLLKLLEETGQVHFTIEGDVITVRK